MAILGGQEDLSRATAAIARRLPPALEPLAAIAYDFAWSWHGGELVFSSLDADRWERCGHNPVRLLLEAREEALEQAAADPRVQAAVDRLVDRLHEHPRARLDLPDGVDDAHPVAFVCAEFGVHESLPLYAGGLGVLAGDILKLASDRGLPMVAVGLLYRYGYLHQRLDLSGWQHEYWTYLDPARRPLVKVTENGDPVTVQVPLWDGELTLHVWRTDVGHVPLYLLDADDPTNDPLGRWVTARLYESSGELRLAQYAALGIGSVRMLEAFGITPAVVHLNEGHAAMAALELAANAPGETLEDRISRARERIVFTTHTPVAAGNETYWAGEIDAVVGDLATRLGTTTDELVKLGRVRPNDAGEPFGLTPLALRTSRHANAVSARHGEVARDMWHPVFPEAERAPIGHVTNGVHVGTWLSGAMRALLDRYLGPNWMRHASDPGTWSAVADIPADELWQTRSQLRRTLVDHVRSRVATDRLRRGEPLDIIRGTATLLDPDRLTIGFARRLTTYKRLHLLTLDSEQLAQALGGQLGAQLVVAGKAHPSDHGGKRAMQALFTFRRDHGLVDHVAILENQDLAVSRALVAGCDVWLNTPMPPMEASGTSGMKAALNGALQMSVLDGWWAEAHRPDIGWALPSEAPPAGVDRDLRDAAVLAEMLRSEVLPEFYDRDDSGVPHRWVERIRRSMLALGPFAAGDKMLADYEQRVYSRVLAPTLEPTA